MQLKEIRSLAELVERDQRAFRAKATSLARLLRWGLPVPDGFVLSFAGCEPLVLDDNDKEAIRWAFSALE